LKSVCFEKLANQLKETYILGEKNKVTDIEKSRYGRGISEHLVLEC
jgi:hypothetical protein